jgi:hypothetical protein
MDYIEFYILIHNNTFCAEYQIKTIRHFCKDPYKITLIDSNCGAFESKSTELKMLCFKENIELLQLPNDLEMESTPPSIRLGLKLNYVYETFVKSRKPRYFAFVDQDMFPYMDFQKIPFLDKYGMWGDVDEPDKNKSPSIYKNDMIDGPWHLHPWLSFFKLDYVINEKLDFTPRENTDTGGSLWTSFIQNKHINKGDYWFRDNIKMLFPYKSISNAGPPPYEDHYFLYRGSPCYGQIQINNEFIHMLNSPNDLLHPKLTYTKGFLDSRLEM